MLKQNSAGAISNNLLLSTVAAFLVAVFILLAFVLPAEYGKDPTGLGKMFGVHKMSVADTTAAPIETDSIDTALNNTTEQAVQQSSAKIEGEGTAHTSYQTPLQFMQTDVVLAAGAEVEYKFDLQANNKVNYVWFVKSGGLAYADLHGHTPGPSGTPDDEILVKYLDTQEASRVSGEFIAPFAGEHGWYFLNLELEEITITVQASGHWDKHELLPIEAE